MIQTNKRNCHIRGKMNYISNVEPSKSAFEKLRTSIMDIGKGMAVWGEDYPVRWINLERALNKLRKEKHTVLKLENIIEVAKNCSVPITSKEEVILFLEFQHKMGNVIFYNDESLNDCVIIEPSWLINAFKCIVCADEFRKFSAMPNYKEITTFKEKGVLSEDILRKMFENEHSVYLPHMKYVLGVMEKFDIIVKVKDSSFVCPSLIEKQSSTLEKILDDNGIHKEERSSWLCIEFAFLPPALYNHLLVYCMRDSEFEKPDLFHEIGVFCKKGSNELELFVLCKSKNTIAVQIWSRSKNESMSEKKKRMIKNGHTLFGKLSS